MTGSPVRPDPVSASRPVRDVRIGRFVFQGRRPLVMGIVNLTPDSFYDGGRFSGAQDAIDHARRLVDEGADIIDLGAESTRPGAAPVSEETEIGRLKPLLGALAGSGVPVSVDTMKPRVMQMAIDEGAAMVNDVFALRLPGAVEVMAGSEASVCLMHMQGDPRNMQNAPAYSDVVSEVRDFLQARANAATAAGIVPDRIIVDPGFGFGKTVEHNMRLLAGLGTIRSLGFPVLFGASRKSSLGAITGRAPGSRLPASLAAAVLAAERGASILRVHDVGETRDVLAVLSEMCKYDA